MPQTLSYSNGGIGGQNYYYNTYTSTAITLTNASVRIPVRLQCTTGQWRLKLRDYDSLLSAAKTPLTADGVSWGNMAAASTGATAQTGSYDSTGATAIVTTSAPIPGDGSFYVSPWVTASANQFQQGKDHLVGVAFHAPSMLSMQTGIGQCWYWGDNTSALSASVAGSAASNPASWIPIDWVIEYQPATTGEAWLIVGDSISEGTTGPAYALAGTITNAAPTALWRGQWEQWAARRGVMVQRNCLYASPASTWANPSYTGWTRQDCTQGQFAGAVLALGANDIKGGRTFSQLQADYTSCLTNLRNLVGTTVPVYGLTVMAESMSGTQETYRMQFNNWLTQGVTGLTGVVDVESEMRSVQSNALDSQLTCDSIHPSYQGQAKLTEILLAAIP